MKTLKKNKNQQSIKQTLLNYKEFCALYDNELRGQNQADGLNKYRSLKRKPLLFVNNLYKKYPRKKEPTINNISFNVYPGEFHAFIGANGAGKTTTIKCLIGAYARWSGTVLMSGQKNVTEQAKKKLGYIPENARFPSGMNCFNYLSWMARLSGLTKKEAKKFTISKLEELNMWNLRKKSPNTFSSGQKKKVLLAQALIHDPDILIMDEPAANLDPKARIEFFENLIALKNRGKSIFISSHVLAELDKYTNALTILDGGKIVYTGSIKDLYAKYAVNKLAITTSDNKKLVEFFKESFLDYKYDEVKEWYITQFPSKIQENEFVSFVANNKISILKYLEIGNSLDDIYKSLIKLGSVDTMSVAHAKTTK